MTGRKFERFPTLGIATLRSSENILAGGVADLSMLGVGLCFDAIPDDAAFQRKTWICTVTSNDIEAPIECTIRVMRQDHSDTGTVLGCQIVYIGEQPYRLLKRFCADAATRQ